MYLWKADDCHLPSDLMVESGIPAKLAEVAAPMRKLCPLNLDTSNPEEDKAKRIDRTRNSLERGWPDDRRNKGPGIDGRIAR